MVRDGSGAGRVRAGVGGAAQTVEPVRRDFRVGIEQHDVGPLCARDAAIDRRGKTAICFVVENLYIWTTGIFREQRRDRGVRARIVDHDQPLVRAALDGVPEAEHIAGQRTGHFHQGALGVDQVTQHISKLFKGLAQGCAGF